MLYVWPGVKVAEMIVQLADNRNYSIAKFIACEHALSSSQSSSSFIFNFLYIDNHWILKKKTKNNSQVLPPLFWYFFLSSQVHVKIWPKAEPEVGPTPYVYWKQMILKHSPSQN